MIAIGLIGTPARFNTLDGGGLRFANIVVEEGKERV